MKEPRRLPPWLKMLVMLGILTLSIVIVYNFVIWILAPTEEDIIEQLATPTAIPTTPTPTVAPTSTPRPTPTINPNQSYELSTLSQNNDMVKGWITIPGIGIDTAIMQGEDNEYFLDHDNILNPNPSGAVFFDYRSDISFMHEAGHVVMYGYNLEGGRQLKRVLRYEYKDYFYNNSLIIMETIYGKFNFRVFSVHKLSDDKDYTEPVNEKKMGEFIETCVSESMFEPKEVPDSDSVILTISTDIDDDEVDRFLVHAYLE
jgi:SrtB family sortase